VVARAWKTAKGFLEVLAGILPESGSESLEKLFPEVLAVVNAIRTTNDS